MSSPPILVSSSATNAMLLFDYLHQTQPKGHTLVVPIHRMPLFAAGSLASRMRFVQCKQCWEIHSRVAVCLK